MGRASLKIFIAISWAYKRWKFICGDIYLWITSNVSYKVFLSGEELSAEFKYFLNFDKC